MRFVRSRQVAREHLAWIRAIAEGIDPVEAWNRYLFLDGDYSEVWSRELLYWVKSEVSELLVRDNKGGLCEAIQAVEIKRHDKRITIDELRGEFPEDFYSEAELLEVLRERLGESAGAAALEDRLRERVAEATRAVDALIARLSQGPCPADHVSRWFRASIAEKLVEHGVHTINDLLVAGVESRQWYLSIPGIGALGAKKINSWLASNFQNYERPLEYRPPLLPTQSAGTAEIIEADTRLESDDEAAVRGWISVKARRSQETKRYYEKEARRFFIFLRTEYPGRTLKDVDIQVCANFFDWLGAIGRESKEWRWTRDCNYWICKPSTRLSAPGWRPFTGAQTQSSMKATERALNAMFVYLSNIKYLTSNPMAHLPKLQKSSGSLQFRSRALATEYVDRLISWRGVAGKTCARDRVVMVLALSTGLRASEVVRARARQFRLLADGWWMSVVGKGGKVRDVPVEVWLIGELESWSGLTFGASDVEDDFLFTRVDPEGLRQGGEPVSYQSILRGVARVCRDVADDVESAGDVRGARRLREATTHWLRHSFATGMLDSPTPPPLNAVRQILGHEDLSSTSLYTSLDSAALRKAISKPRA